MTIDEIISMAREAGLSITPPRSGQYDGGRVGGDVVGLKRFTDLVVAHEREQCAKVCDTTPPYPFRPSIEAAHAIRAKVKAQGVAA